MTTNECIEQQLVEAIKKSNLVPITTCKYQLPCGLCDKTGEICSQLTPMDLRGGTK